MRKKTKISEKPRISSPFDTTIHKTEWTCAAKVAEWMNTIIREKQLPLGQAEVETTLEGDRKRADINLFESPSSQKVLCVIEMKPPYFDVFDENELKEPARQKATQRKAPYFATSNFKQLLWFNTERVNSLKPEEEQLHEKYALSELENLDLIEEPKYKNSILAGLEHFLVDLHEVHTGKKTEPRQAIDELLVFRLQQKIKRLAGFYQPIIEDKSHKDAEFSAPLQRWFVEQNWNFAWQAADFAKAARQAAYLLVNKILFYNLLQAKRPHQLDALTIPEDLTKGGLLQRQLQGYFDYVLQNIDYETIYSTDFIDQTAFPDSKAVVEEIKELIRLLKRYDFSRLGYDILGRIFERLIPEQERHNLGQYFTNPDIVDLILRFCLRHEQDKVFDPACGAGTFLVRAYQHKKLMNQRLKHRDILKTLWGCDIAKFPAHLATINLAINDLGVDDNYPYILREDFFALKYGGREEFTQAARKRELVGLGEKKIVIPYPKVVDCIVGNPPYTRQEEIPEIAGEEGYKAKLIENALSDGKVKLAEISKRAGIHAYFFVHGTKFLSSGGRFGFIVSESWLDVDYGKGLQEFFIKNYKLIAIIASKVERWFEDADINTCIVILERCADFHERDENFVRFVSLLKPLRHFIPPAQDMWEKQKARLDQIDALIQTIRFHGQFYQNDELRIFPKKQADLWEEGFDNETGKYVGAKWGKYLRAPEIFFKILEKRKDKLVRLGDIAEVRRGFTTGANEFFYLTEEQIRQKSIEREFWMHQDEQGNWVPNYVIKSPRECKSILVKSEDLKYRVLLIHKDKQDLKGTNALKYIEEGERKGYHQRPTCQSRGERWYDLGQRARCDGFWIYVLNDRYVTFSNLTSVFADCELFDIRLTNESLRQTLFALLNASLIPLFSELGGRTVLGQGALKTQVYEVERFLIPNPLLLSQAQIQQLTIALNQLSQRPISSVFEEIGADSPEAVSLERVKEDRRELDKIVMGDILGLTDEEQLEVYRAVVDLVKSRIQKAKSVGKGRKTKDGLDVDLLVETVLEKLEDQTLGNFYREKILSQEANTTKALPKTAGKMQIEQALFGWRLVSGSQFVECASEAEARYLRLWQSIGLEAVQVPEDKGYLETIVPELEALKAKIDEIVESYLGAIVEVKTRKKILQQLWREIHGGI